MLSYRKLARGSKGAIALVAGITAAVSALQPSEAMAQKTWNIKIGMATINDPQQKWAERIGAELKKRSNGRLTYQIFPASQLGIIPRQVEGILLGTQEMFITPPGFFVGVNPAFMVPDAPGVYASAEHGQKVFDDPEFHDKFMSLGESKGVLGTGLMVYDMDSIASVRPVRSPDDLKGMKLRVLATPLERAVPAAFGATGVPIPFTEVVPALQQGVVDGARTSLVVMAYAKFQTVTKYLTVINDGVIPSGVWVSKAWANKLPADLREMVLSVPKETQDWAAAYALSNVSKMTKVWHEAGAEVMHFSPADHERYMAKLRPLGENFLSKHPNPQVREMWALFKKVLERHRPKT